MYAKINPTSVPINPTLIPSQTVFLIVWRITGLERTLLKTLVPDGFVDSNKMLSTGTTISREIIAITATIAIFVKISNFAPCFFKAIYSPSIRKREGIPSDLCPGSLARMN